MQCTTVNCAQLTYLPCLYWPLGCRIFSFCILLVCRPALLYSYDLKIVVFTVMFSTPFIKYIPALWALLTMGKVGSPTRHGHLAEMENMSIGIQKICRQDISCVCSQDHHCACSQEISCVSTSNKRSAVCQDLPWALQAQGRPPLFGQ